MVTDRVPADAETVVLLFTDLEGSTRAWATAGMLHALDVHDSLLRAAVIGHRGDVFKHTGDGVCATFPSVHAAVQATLDAQAALAAEDWGDGPRLRSRMAIHVGNAYRRGDDWFGLSLSRVARLMALGRGGQVLLSGTAASLWSEIPIPGVRLIDRGAAVLRDLREVEHVWQVDAAVLDTSAPRIAASSPVGNLPVFRPSLVGRRDELAALDRHLDERRIVVLTGPGGIGKTSLATAAAAQVGHRFPGGTWVVELAATAEPGDVPTLIATALGVRGDPGGDAVGAVVRGIADRTLLLILDNCEHLIGAAADVVTLLVSRCPNLRILATSREALGVDGERVVRVSSLAPDTDAAALFVERARDAGVELDAGALDRVAAVCRRLDGVPLAVELAAARLSVLPMIELEARLDDLDALKGTRSGRIDRHRTLRAAIDWSYGLLDQQERETFAQISVFVGRFELEAAEVVIRVDGPKSTIELLSGLVDKSVLLANAGSPAPFSLLEPLRQYGAERAVELGQVKSTADRHTRYYAQLANRLGAASDSKQELVVYTRLDSARDNLRAAFTRVSEAGDIDTAFELLETLDNYSSGRIWAEPWTWSDIALEMPGAMGHPRRAGVLTVAGEGAWQLSDYHRAVDLGVEAQRISQPGTNVWRRAILLQARGLAFLGQWEEATERCRTVLNDDPDALGTLGTLLLIENQLGRADPLLARRLLDKATHEGPSIHALALHVASMVLPDGDRSRVIAYNEQARALAASCGAVLVEGFALMTLARAEGEDDPIRGIRARLDAMDFYLRRGNQTHAEIQARLLIEPLVAIGAHDLAALVDGGVSTELPHSHEGVEEAISTARRALGKSYDRFLEEGRALGLDELIARIHATVDAFPLSTK